MSSTITVTIPSRRSHSQVEVIDVDEPPHQRRRLANNADVVDLTVVDLTGDSDDEMSIVGSSSTARHARPVISRNSRRLVSLPPPPQDNRIPPVPQLPRELAHYRSYPMRQNPPAMPRDAGAVRPNTQPFAFEAHIQQPEATNGFAPQAAPRSHYQPSMGLGGALVSNRVPQPRRARQSSQPSQLIQRHRRNRMPPTFNDDEEPPHSMVSRLRNISAHLVGRFGFERPLGDLLRRGGFDNPETYGLHFHTPKLQEEEDYITAYTHPEKPEAGFSNDFSPTPPTPVIVVDSTQSSSSSGPSPTYDDYNTILVCAKCLDPLVLTESIANPEEVKRRRVWGLRCGHIIDGKCMDELTATAAIEIESNNTKGKAKAVDFIFGPSDSYERPSPVSSRLRSRDSGAHTLPAPEPATTKRKAIAGKGKGKAQDTVEDQRGWECPVTSCKKPHVSVKVGGVWGPGKADGPIAMFV